MNLLIPITIILGFLIANISIKPAATRMDTLGASHTRSTFPTPSTNEQNPLPSSSHASLKEEDNVIIGITHTPNTSAGNTVIYPGAKNISENIYQSNDSPEIITNWYKNFIKEKNMNTTSIVTTNTNDNVKNVLAAYNGIQKLHVEISKNAVDTKTTIKFL